MTPTNQTTKDVKQTVFDLQTFGDVKLVRTVTLPVRPTTIHEALAAVGGDNTALLSVIYDGLCVSVEKAARADVAGFSVVDEDGKVGDLYTGTPVSEEKGKAINAAVLGIAKAMGWSKDMTIDQKNALKDQAMNFIKSNPAMLASIQG
jgi:hypothetical protein